MFNNRISTYAPNWTIVPAQRRKRVLNLWQVKQIRKISGQGGQGDRAGRQEACPRAVATIARPTSLQAYNSMQVRGFAFKIATPVLRPTEPYW